MGGSKISNLKSEILFIEICFKSVSKQVSPYKGRIYEKKQ